MELRPYQVDGYTQLVALAKSGENMLEASTAGFGKTVVIAKACATAGLRPAVVCPKSVIPHWEEILEACGCDPLFVINYEKARIGYAEPYGNWKRRRQTFVWNFPEDAWLIFDEVHECRNRKTQNSKMLVAAARQKNLLIAGVSATCAESPLDMYSIGYMLGLHDGMDEFEAWCKYHGAKRGPFGGMIYTKGAEGMAYIHEQIFPQKGHRCDATKLEGFPKNHVNTLAVPSDGARKVQKELDKIAEKMQTDVALPIVDRIRTRQMVELLKVEALCELAENDIKQGNNVVIFLTSLDALTAIADHFGAEKCAVIHGGQTRKGEREGERLRFQNNEVHVIVCQIRAGGQSIDLHDLYGRPRVSYVCPSDSAIQTVQALGRTPRSGSLSPSIQYLVFAKDTLEERIRKKVDLKINNIAALNDGDLDLFAA